MADSFWFWSNGSPMEQEDIGGGRGRGYCEGHQEQEIGNLKMRKSTVIGFEDDQQNTNVTTTSTAAKKTKGKLYRKKPEKKNPRRGVGIARLEETIKQRNSQLPAAVERQVHQFYNGFPAATSTSQSQSQIQYPPFLHQQQQKQISTSTVSSSSPIHGLNTHIIDAGLLDLNCDINNNGSYNDQLVMNYGSAATNVNNGGLHQLIMNSSHDHQQPYVNLLRPSKQHQQKHWNSTNYNIQAGYNPSAGSVVSPPSKQQQQGSSTYYAAGYVNPSAGSGAHDRHGNNNGTGYNPSAVGSGFRDQHGNHNGFYSPPKVVELSSTQKQQNYDHHFPPQQHSHDHIPLDYQKNLNNGECIGGFLTPYSETTQMIDRKPDFLELGPGGKWNTTSTANGRQIKKNFSSSSSKAAAAGYSNEDQVELLAVHRKGKSSPSSVLMEYEFLSSSIKGHDQYHHSTRGGSNKDYSSNYNSSSSSCIMEESSAFRNGSIDLISSSSQISNSSDHGFLDLSLKLSSYH